MSSPEPADTQSHDAHWAGSLKIVLFLLGIWAFISLGCGILFREFLDGLFSIGGAPFGFWMAQQGAIIGFLILLVAYMVLMNRLDKKCGFDQEEQA
jgi:putative solute:sodium symporter small subunit